MKQILSYRAISYFLPLFILLQLSMGLVAQTNAIRDSLLSVQLFRAIRSGSTDSLKLQISHGADVNRVLGNYSPLMSAAISGSTEQMKILIDHGAAVNFANKDSLTALWMAVPDGEKMRLLLDHGADPRMKSKEHYDVMVKLVTFPGTADLVKLLMDKGVDPKKSSYDNLVLYNAAGSCDTAVVGLLLRAGLSAGDSVSFGDYPLDYAINYRCSDIVKMLVDHGANVNVQPNFFSTLVAGISPLMMAAVSNDKESFYYLLDHGANPNAKSKRGQTPLIFLQQAEYEDPDMTKALIDHGAIVSTKATDGTDALYYALKKGNSRSVEMLKKYLNK